MGGVSVPTIELVHDFMLYSGSVGHFYWHLPSLVRTWAVPAALWHSPDPGHLAVALESFSYLKLYALERLFFLFVWF